MTNDADPIGSSAEAATAEAGISTEYLLAAAAWQDSLLQSYRALLLSTQSILFAIGVGLFIAELALTTAWRAYLVCVVLILVGALGLYSTLRLRSVVLARGRDVNFWHRELIMAENKNQPSDRRPFTEFKVHQKAHRKGLTEKFLSSAPIDAADVELLVERGLGHTRKVVDRNLGSMLAGAWCLLMAAGVGYAAYIAAAGI